MRPLAIDLFCGLGGWTEGLLAVGYDVVGFDIERHDYGTGGYPAQLVLQDVLTLHGSQFKDAALIVASPPCQAYSYRAMPWKRVRALPPPSNELFDACFRIQREACEAAGRNIPLIVENVRGAQPFVGQARWHYGSFYLWGDVPALMPPVFRAAKVPGLAAEVRGEKTGLSAVGFNVAAARALKTVGHPNRRDTGETTKRLTNPAEWGVKGFTPEGQPLGKNVLGSMHGSKSKGRKAASAQIAKIPVTLSKWIGETYFPREVESLA